MGIGFQIDDFIQFHVLYLIKIRGLVFSMITNFSNIDVKTKVYCLVSVLTAESSIKKML